MRGVYRSRRGRWSYEAYEMVKSSPRPSPEGLAPLHSVARGCKALGIVCGSMGRALGRRDAGGRFAKRPYARDAGRVWGGSGTVPPARRYPICRPLGVMGSDAKIAAMAATAEARPESGFARRIKRDA